MSTTWDSLLGGVSSGLSNAAQDAASYVLPALAGGIANTVQSAAPAAKPGTGTPTDIPIGLYSAKQMGDAAAAAAATPPPVTRPAWVMPVAVGAAVLLGVLVYKNLKG